MPGICAIVDRPSAPVGQQVADMLSSMEHHDWYVTESYSDLAAGIGLGRISLGFLETQPQPVNFDDDALVAVMHGEIYNYDELRNSLAKQGVKTHSEAHAEVVAFGIHTAGPEFLRSVSGSFVIAVWDGRQRRLIVANDRFGTKPCYYSQINGRLLAASEIKALLLDPEVSRTPHLRGVAQFFSFGQLLGPETLLEGVQALPPASWLTFDATEHQLSLDRYWRLSETCRPNRLSRHEMLDALDDAFCTAVLRRLGGTRHLGLSLSGGLDARSILGVIDHEATPLKSVSMGIEGSLDHKSARQMAALAHGDHHECLLDEGVVASFEETMHRMVHLTDGHYLDQCIVLPTLPLYRKLGIEVLLRGHAGELMHMNKAYNFSLDLAAWSLRDSQELEDWLYKRLSSFMQASNSISPLRSITRDELEELARESLKKCLAESAEVEPLIHRIWHLFITQRLTRETAVSLAKIGTEMEIRIPLLDEDLVPLLMSAPPELKVGETIQTYILRRHFPEFLRILNANTGAPMGAGRLRQQAAWFKMKVLAKLGVKGYQPYERLGLWLRRELSPFVKSVLLDDRCLERGVYEPNAVRRIIDEHTQNRVNHTFLLLAMMIHELGQRKLLESKASVASSGETIAP